jgi:hypothetical protein
MSHTKKTEISYEIMQADMVVASACGKRAHLEILHYASQYEQDGSIEIFRVTREPVTAAQLTAPADRNAVLEEAARVIDEGQETITTITSDGEENVRHITKRSRGNLTGIAFAGAIRALKAAPQGEGA